MKIEEEILAAILRKLFVMKKIGRAVHTPIENIQKSFPKHMRGYVNKKVIPQMIKEGFIVTGKHNYGLGVSLNPERLNDIRKILKENFPDQFVDF